jgi:hypothetical protein
MTVECARAGASLAPTRPGGFDDTPVGRLPTGPAADAALAAAAPRPDRAPATVDPAAPADGARHVAVRRVAAAVAAVVGAVAVAAALRARRRR